MSLIYIPSGSVDAIEEALHDQNIERGVFTYGTYVAPQDVILPTTLAGFKFATDRFSRVEDAIIVAVNSEESMKKIYQSKMAKIFAAIQDEIDALEGEEREHAASAATSEKILPLMLEYAALENSADRAAKLAGPLAEQFPDRKVVVMFYDEETPKELYEGLALKGFGMTALFKWGYGTNPDAPRIEGAHNFQNVLAFPFMNDAKALCHDITVAENQSDVVKVFKLHEAEGDRPAYMTKDGQLLFDLVESLRQYAVPVGGVAGDAAPMLGR
jgi:hypothetical protein